MFKSSYLSKGIKQLLIINSIVFIFTSLFPPLISILSAHTFDSPNFQTYQLITYMFVHGNISHIFFNMLTLCIFGVSLEKRINTKLLWFSYIICGIGSYFTQMIFTSPTDALIGASGSVFGIMALYTLFYPNEEFYLLFIPIPIKIKNLFIIYIIIELLSLNNNDNIGHLAHLGGALVGTIIYFSIKNKKR